MKLKQPIDPQVDSLGLFHDAFWYTFGKPNVNRICFWGKLDDAEEMPIKMPEIPNEFISKNAEMPYLELVAKWISSIINVNYEDGWMYITRDYIVFLKNNE